MKCKPLIGKIINGLPVADGETSLSCWDQGLLCGYGLFETMLVRQKTILAVNEHLQRLIGSCVSLDIVEKLSCSSLADIVQGYVATNNLEEGSLRLSITKGNPSQGVEPIFIIVARDLQYGPNDYKHGFRAVVSPQLKNETSVLVYHKTLNNLENTLALEAAHRQGANEVLFLNTRHLLTEGAKSNLFFVRGHTLYTPSVTCGLLNGVTRQSVIRLSGSLGLCVVEGEYSLKNLLAADEAFLTNSLMEIMPLVSIGNQPIGCGQPGRITMDILRRYRQLTC